MLENYVATRRQRARFSRLLFCSSSDMTSCSGFIVKDVRRLVCDEAAGRPADTQRSLNASLKKQFVSEHVERSLNASLQKEF